MSGSLCTTCALPSRGCYCYTFESIIPSRSRWLRCRESQWQYDFAPIDESVYADVGGEHRGRDALRLKSGYR